MDKIIKDSNKPLILASASPRRRELLQKLDIPFEVIPSDAEENNPKGMDAWQTVIYLSTMKAEQVAGFKQGIIIGADTVVTVDQQILGKPTDKQDAKRMLQMLSGRKHEVLTGVCLIDTISGKKVSDCAVTEVWFDKLDDTRMDAYIASGEPMDKAGAYAIQGTGGLFVSRICGCYDNVVGLPVHLLWHMLIDLQK